MKKKIDSKELAFLSPAFLSNRIETFTKLNTATMIKTELKKPIKPYYFDYQQIKN
nr:hypothetical protein [Pedobacter glucosidilyticus]